jgi:hypothetical protein
MPSLPGIRTHSFLLRWFLPAAVALAPVSAVAVAPTVQDSSANTSALSRSFQCPESYPSDEARRLSLENFLKSYAAASPNNNTRDVMLFRYRLLVEHSCMLTLKSMLERVTPLSAMLSVQNNDFVPRTEEFDPKTKVWTVRFRKDGEPEATAEQELIFNFYGWRNGPSAQSIATAFVRRRDNVQVLGSFEAPDDLTRLPAYIVVSETIYPGDSYGYVNISKISSVGSGAFTVTYTKKISGPDMARKGAAWLLTPEGKAFMRTVEDVGVDPGWEQYFAHGNKAIALPH